MTTPALRIRRRLHGLLNGDSRPLELFMLALIAVNVVALMLETVEAIRAAAPRGFLALEAISVAIFTIEYALRVWTCVEDPRYAHPVAGRLRYALSPMALIDLTAILPFYLPQRSVDLRFVRILRLTRVFRFGRYSAAIRTVFLVVRTKRAELLSTLFMLVLLLVLSASLMWLAEHKAQPEKFSSIPAALWWAIVTITTIGYGDVHPITPFGKLICGFVAVVGVCTIALPTGIFASGFIEALSKPSDAAPATCPHCARPLSAST